MPDDESILDTHYPSEPGSTVWPPARQDQAVRREIACMDNLCIPSGCIPSGVYGDNAVARPVLLDLFCGAGGAAVGYHRAGFDVVGVDIEPQPDYPFAFHQDDALQFLNDNAQAFDAVHASPPCQRYCRTNRGTNGNHRAYPDLVADTRRALERTALPYVIENVPGAPLHEPVTLCGEMFGLRVIRHRLFESNHPLLQPEHPRHRGRVHGHNHGVNYTGYYFTVAGHGGGADGTFNDWCSAMDIGWITTKRALTQAVPPAYTEMVGARLLAGMQPGGRVNGTMNRRRPHHEARIRSWSGRTEQMTGAVLRPHARR